MASRRQIIIQGRTDRYPLWPGFIIKTQLQHHTASAFYDFMTRSSKCKQEDFFFNVPFADETINEKKSCGVCQKFPANPKTNRSEVQHKAFIPQGPMTCEPLSGPLRARDHGPATMSCEMVKG